MQLLVYTVSHVSHFCMTENSQPVHWLEIAGAQAAVVSDRLLHNLQLTPAHIDA